MKVCTNCKQEMRCTKTGAAVRFGNDVYRGDRFECSCGSSIIITASSGTFDPERKIEAIEMLEAKWN